MKHTYFKNVEGWFFVANTKLRTYSVEIAGFASTTPPLPLIILKFQFCQKIAFFNRLIVNLAVEIDDR